jgi:hypothetical protein
MKLRYFSGNAVTIGFEHQRTRADDRVHVMFDKIIACERKFRLWELLLRSYSTCITRSPVLRTEKFIDAKKDASEIHLLEQEFNVIV